MGAPDNFLYQLTSMPSVDAINEAIMIYAVSPIKSDHDALQFCDIMDTLVDCDASRQFITALRHGKDTVLLFGTHKVSYKYFRNFM